MKVFHAIDRDACFVGRARPGGDNQVGRSERLNLFDRNLVVSHYLEIDLAVDFTDPLCEVVGERVVVVDD